MKLNKKLKKTYLGKRGYIIFKKYFDKKRLQQIRDKLTVTPNIPNDYNENVESFKVFLENKNKMYLPKVFGIKEFGKPDANKVPKGDDIDINFVFTLRDNQKKPIEVCLEKYDSVGGGILSLPCAYGKTIMGCYLIAKKKKKTLVVVDQGNLVDQWIERIGQSCPGAKVGIIQGKKFDIEGKDIVIGMIQSLWKKDYGLNAFDSFGHVIIDECHTVSSHKFSKTLHKVNAPYMLGLSATPTRKDGLTKVLKWHIGDILYTAKTENIIDIDVERVIVKSMNSDYGNQLMDFKGRVRISTMLNKLAYFLVRSNAIIKVIVDTLSEHKDRQILLLSDRKQQLEDIYKIIKKHDYCSVGYFIGGMKQDDLNESMGCQLILATYGIAAKGLDIKSLNCLIMATPRSDVRQAVGRVIRDQHKFLVPKIIDIVDNFSVFKNQGKKRFDLYKKRKYKIKDIIMDIDNIKVISTRTYKFHEDNKKSKTSSIPTQPSIKLTFSKGF